MTSSMTAVGLALAIAFASSPVAAQQAPAPAAQASITPSRQAHAAILALQTAVKANDVANIPALVTAAQAAATTAEDHYLIAALRYQAATAAKDEAGTAAAIEALLASQLLPASERMPLTLDLAAAHYELKQYDKAAAGFEKALASDPANKDALVMFAETRQAQGRTEEAIALFKRAIAAASAGGAKADEGWYKRALALAYKAKLPSSLELSRDWLAAYPSRESWRDALRIYRQMVQLDDEMTLDSLRLARAAGALESDAEFDRYGYLAITTGYPGEAKALLDEAVAAKAIDPSTGQFKDMIALAKEKSAGERATFDDAVKAALAAPQAKRALTTGDMLYGYGEYARAAELYRAALGKAGADKDLVNLHLGMALAQAGDKAGAAAALNAVGGKRAELAKYWLVFANTRA